MTAGIGASYDATPYEGTSFFYTHPEALAVAGTLRGVTPPNIETCRLLEIGCALGGNLIPMAFTLPGAQFTGIDLSERQISEGQSRVQALGLSNVKLLKKDVLEIDETFGTFDYIICHGVFSWVPDAVREAILRVFSKNLSPNGLAYLSFNVYPGWHLKSLVRKMLLHRFRGETDFASRMTDVRDYLEDMKFLYDRVNTTQSPSLVSVIQHLLMSPDHYLLHEYLEAENQPYYFHEVVERAQGAGLLYIAEQKATPVRNLVSADVWDRLEGLARDAVEMEQYGDFLLSGSFHSSVFARDGVDLVDSPSLDQIKRFLVHARARPASEFPQVRDGSPERFGLKDGKTVTTNDPYVIAALTVAHRFWPSAVGFTELVEAARDLYGSDLPSDGLDLSLSQALQQCHRASLVSFRLRQPGFTPQAGPRPLGSPLARFQAEYSRSVTNLMHESLSLTDFDRFVLLQLDGNQTRGDLTTALENAIRQGEIGITGLAPEAVGPDLYEILLGLIDESLDRLASHAFLST
jgi:methyltransferase-like protein/ubiquinone/menaquinone biosynthesis C-methylase UbiE